MYPELLKGNAIQIVAKSSIFYILFYFIVGVFGLVLCHPDSFQYSVVLHGYWMHAAIYLSGNVTLIDL